MKSSEIASDVRLEDSADFSAKIGRRPLSLFFSCPPPFFSDLLSFVLFVLNYAHFLAVNTLLQSIFARSTLVLLISFVHIHCTTYSVFKFKIFVLDFLFNTFLYSKYIVRWTIFYCPYLVKKYFYSIPHLLIC